MTEDLQACFTGMCLQMGLLLSDVNKPRLASLDGLLAKGQRGKEFLC